MRDFINKDKYRMYINSIQQMNENSIEFSLSTWTRSSSKTSWPKSLQNDLLHFVDVNFVTIVDNSCQHPISFCILDKVLSC